MGNLVKATICILILIITISLVSFSKFSSDNNKRSANCSDLIGNWEAVGTPNRIKIKFCNDSMYFSLTLGGDWGNNVIACLYSCRTSYDSIFITTREERPNRFLFIKITDQFFVLCWYKNAKGVEDLISSLVTLVRKDANFSDKLKKTAYEDLIRQYGRNPDIFMLPKGRASVMAIAFDQVDGIKPVMDAMGNKIYNITDTNSFLVKVTGHPDLFNFVTNNIRFYSKSLKDSLIRMPVYKYYDSIPDDSIVNKIHVYSVGYDRIGRNKINSIIGGDIKSNILFFKITRDLFYNENCLGRDSVLYNGKYYQLSMWK